MLCGNACSLGAGAERVRILSDKIFEARSSPLSVVGGVPGSFQTGLISI